ncbi:unannotated protein [freshwater metagenome]|uniref:Unannotated protein n=1 Tax=freshwater metagenome TaxID=449393 RepID=A0A6J6NJK2_9ZZZZ
MNAAWDEVWERRTLDAEKPLLAALLAADGLDTGFGDVREDAWREATARWVDELGLSEGDSVFEVGCGAGAFLYALREHGIRVSGIDRSSTLIGYARDVMPEATFAVADAADFDLGEQADIVVAFGVFMYFPELDYATGVLERMVAKARRAVAVIDVPDKAHEAEALARRIATVGGEDAYRERYAGLDHLYYDRAWFANAMSRAGIRGPLIADQWLKHYENGRSRFNAWGELSTT